MVLEVSVPFQGNQRTTTVLGLPLSIQLRNNLAPVLALWPPPLPRPPPVPQRPLAPPRHPLDAAFTLRTDAL